MSRLTFALFVLVAAASQVRADDPVSYARDVVPFLEEHCIACHDDGFETSKLALHNVEAMKKGGRHGPAIIEGKGADSALIQYMTGKKQPQMPPKTSLSLAQIDVIKRWIDQGAKVDNVGAMAAKREQDKKVADREAAVFSSDAPPPVTSLAYSPDSRRLAVASYKEVIVVDARTGRTLKHLPGFPEQVNCVGFSPDGTMLAAASGTPGRQGEVRIWETAQWKEVRVLRGHSDTILALAWRPRSVTYRGFDKSGPFPFMKAQVKPGGSELATAGIDKRILIWDVKSGKPIRTLNSHSEVVHGLAYSPDGSKLGSASADKLAKVFNADTGLQLAALMTHQDAVYAISFSPDGTQLATAGADKFIFLWKLGQWNNPLIRFDHTGPVTSLAWRPNGRSVWAGSGGQPSFLSYRAENAHRDVEIEGRTMSKDWVYAVAMSPDGEFTAAAGWDGKVLIWRLRDGKPFRDFIPGRSNERTLSGK